MILTREAILAVQDIRIESVDVPEWGGSVLVRALTAAEREIFEVAATSGDAGKRVINWGQFQARLCALAIVDEAGQRVFTDADINALAAKSGAAVTRVFALAQKLAGLGAEDIEEITRNFTATQPGGSLSS